MDVKYVDFMTVEFCWLGEISENYLLWQLRMLVILENTIIG